MMTNSSWRWWMAPAAAVVLCLAVSACKTTRPDTSQASASSEALAPGARPTLLADVAPIAALADDGRYLWIGSARGLRRVHLATRASEWVNGPATGFSARQVTALAADGRDTLWTGTEAGLGVLEESPTGPRYRAVARIPGITHIVPIAATPGRDDAWVGTETGLFRVDGRSVTPVEFARDDAVTFLDPDGDGRSVWVGLRARGMLRVDPSDASLLATALTAVGPGFAGSLDFVDPLGTTLLSNGTRVAYGHARNGATRLAVLSTSGPVLMTPEPETAIQTVIQGSPAPARPTTAPTTSASRSSSEGSADGDFIAGPDATPTRYQLMSVPRGELLPPGTIRFLPLHKSLNAARMIARPVGALGLESVTMALHGSGAAAGVFIGTRSSGTARTTGADTIPVASGELALGATGLSVMCVDPQRCFLATGTGTGWTWAAGSGGLLPLAALFVGGRLMALAGDGTDATFSISGGPGKILRVARLSSGGARFDPVVQIPIDVEGAAVASRAMVSPSGSVWIAVRDRAADGSESGRGAVELQLPNMRVVHHHPYRKHEAVPPDVIPLAGDVRAIRFQPAVGSAPEAIWFCTSSGIIRSREGRITRWAEDNGLDDERCADLLLGKDGTVWAATVAGVLRFDGASWRAADKWPAGSNGDAMPARGLIAIGDEAWAATPAGLWPISGTPRSWDRHSGLLDDDVFAVTVDRFSRLWILGGAGVTLIDPAQPGSRSVF